MYFVTHENHVGAFVIAMSDTNDGCHKLALRERAADPHFAENIKERDTLANVFFGDSAPLQNGDYALAAAVALDLAAIARDLDKERASAESKLDTHAVAMRRAMVLPLAEMQQLHGSPLRAARQAARALETGLAAGMNERHTPLRAVMASLVELEAEGVVALAEARDQTGLNHMASERIRNGKVREENLAARVHELGVDRDTYRRQRDEEGARAVKAERALEAMETEACNVAGILDTLLEAIGQITYGIGREHPAVMAAGRVYIQRGAELAAYVEARR